MRVAVAAARCERVSAHAEVPGPTTAVERSTTAFTQRRPASFITTGRRTRQVLLRVSSLSRAFVVGVRA